MKQHKTDNYVHRVAHNTNPILLRVVSIVLVVTFISALGARLLHPSHAATTGFITRSGTQLFLNGQQYKFASLNANGMTQPDCRGEGAPTQAQLTQFFSTLAPHSMVRTWYFDDSNQSLMDMAVATAAKYHQFLTVTLIDSAPQSSGAIGQCGSLRPQYVSNFFGGGYKGSYFTHVRNTVTRYKDSPAIGIWEIANEGNGGGNTAFYTDTAALIKSIDPNHLVGSGSMPEYAFGSQSSYEAAQGGTGSNIDLVSVHEYDAATGESGWVTGAGDQAAKDLNKPVYVGEDGFCCGGGDTGSSGGNASKLTSEYNAYINDPYVAGMMYWNFDFVNNNDPTNMSFGNALFAAETSYKNKYPGGADGAMSTTPTTPAAPPTPTDFTAGTYNDTDLTYAGTGWQTSYDAAKYQGDDHYSNTAGDTATMVFTGTQIKLYGGEAPQYGKVSVAIDGDTATTIDLYAATRTDQFAFYTSPALANAKHTVVVTVLGTKDASATDTVVSLDKVDVIETAAATTAMTGDINGDGHVNTLDLSVLLTHDGTNYAPADLNHDGTVGAADLAILLSHWKW